MEEMNAKSKLFIFGLDNAESRCCLKFSMLKLCPTINKY